MKRIIRLFLVLLLTCFISFSIWIVIIVSNLPDPGSIKEYLPQQSIQILDRNDRLLYEVLPESSGRYREVQSSEIPDYFKHATIATEDINFYQHPGIDLIGILRAIWIDIQTGELKAGGSTITQQLARNLLINENERNERTIRRKIRESYLAWMITKRFTKDEVLTLYLNQSYFGGLAYGAEAAAQTFFGKHISELDLAECALLAGLPQSPARYNPYTNYESSKERQRIVLGLMEKAGYISKGDRLQAEKETLQFSEVPYPIEAPHFIMMVRNEMDRLLESKVISIPTGRGLIVKTTLDLNWQKLAEKAILQQLDHLKHSEDGLGHQVNNAALVAITPSTGEIRALVGSPDYFDEKSNGAINMAIMPRQPGSALKPLIYAATMEGTQKLPWTAGTMLLDVNTSFLTHEGKVYIPENYDGKEHGPVLLREALASSLNIPAVIALDHLGLESFNTFLQKMGMSSLGEPTQYDLSIALGGGSVSLLELTSAYAVFANSGCRIQPYFISEITNERQEIIYQHTAQEKQQVLDEKIAWLIGDILSDSNARILGFGKNTILQLDFKAAVKTGTTTNFHDNWTIGYTPDLVTGVWTGNTSYEAMREVTGLTGAAPIWHQFMRDVLSNKTQVTWLTMPAGMVRANICTFSGLLATPDCPYTVQEWFILGTEPTQYDQVFKRVTIDLATGKLSDSNTPPSQQYQELALNLPIQAASWANSHGYQLVEQLNTPLAQVVQSPEAARADLIILTPVANSVYRISAKIPVENQAVKITLAAQSKIDQVELWLDGKLLTTLKEAPFKYWWRLAVGSHRLWAVSILNNQEVISPIVTFTVEPPL
jgi:1A family penicillin-binding protein